MFKHIVGYTSILAQLSMYKKTGEWPKTLGFAGSALSGRSSLALELARVWLCESGAEHDCRCRSCTRHSLLEGSDLTIVGPRSSIDDIHYFLRLLASDGNTEAHTENPNSSAHGVGSTRKNLIKQMLLRRLAILLKRFDSAITSDKKKKQIALMYAPLFECLHTDLSEQFPVSYEKIGSYVEQLEQHQLPDLNSANKLQEFCQFGNETGKKVLILENIQQYSIAVMHNILKFTEEPPRHVFIVATAYSKHSFAQNLASRFQWIDLPIRGRDQQAIVCERYFGVSSDSIEAVLQNKDESGIVERLCESFLEDLQRDGNRFWPMLYGCGKEKERSIALSFLKKLPVSLDQMSEHYNKEYLVSMCKDALMHIEARNIEPISAIEGVYSLVHR